jgi:hypothetical protein
MITKLILFKDITNALETSNKNRLEKYETVRKSSFLFVELLIV